MNQISEALLDDLKECEKELQRTISRMQEAIKWGSFDHLARLSVEAARVQAKIDTINETLRIIKYYSK